MGVAAWKGIPRGGVFAKSSDSFVTDGPFNREHNFKRTYEKISERKAPAHPVTHFLVEAPIDKSCNEDYEKIFAEHRYALKNNIKSRGSNGLHRPDYFCLKFHDFTFLNHNISQNEKE